MFTVTHMLSMVHTYRLQTNEAHLWEAFEWYFRGPLSRY